MGFLLSRGKWCFCSVRAVLYLTHCMLEREHLRTLNIGEREYSKRSGIRRFSRHLRELETLQFIQVAGEENAGAEAPPGGQQASWLNPSDPQ